MPRSRHQILLVKLSPLEKMWEHAKLDKLLESPIKHQSKSLLMDFFKSINIKLFTFHIQSNQPKLLFSWDKVQLLWKRWPRWSHLRELKKYVLQCSEQALWHIWWCSLLKRFTTIRWWCLVTKVLNRLELLWVVMNTLKWRLLRFGRNMYKNIMRWLWLMWWKRKKLIFCWRLFGGTET